MVEETNDALELIDNLLATPHPNEERLWMFTQGKIDKGTEPELIRRHIAICSHCRELAHMFDWPESDTKH